MIDDDRWDELQDEMATLRKELERLGAWKESAMKVFAEIHIPHQQFGILGETPGDTIRRLVRERDAALDALVAAAEGYGCCKDHHCDYCDVREVAFMAVLEKAGRR